SNGLSRKAARTSALEGCSQKTNSLSRKEARASRSAPSRTKTTPRPTLDGVMEWPSSVEQAAMPARASHSTRPQRPGRADSSSRRGPTSRSLLKATKIGLQTKAILRQSPDHEVPDGRGACSEKFFKHAA